MKKLMIFLMLALVLILTPTCLFAANFVEICSDDEISVFLDSSSIQDNGTYYRAWIKCEFKEGEKKKEGEILGINKEVDYELFLYAYAKKIKQTCILARYIYDKDGKMIKSFNYENLPLSWESVVPESLGELIILSVYSYAGK